MSLVPARPARAQKLNSSLTARINDPKNSAWIKDVEALLFVDNDFVKECSDP